MADLNPFEVGRKLKTVIGKKNQPKITTMRNGLLLIEVVHEHLYTKLKATKHLDDIPVIIKDHNTLNSSKGRIYCNNKEVRKMTDDDVKDELKNQNVTDVYRIKKRKENSNDLENTDTFIVTFGDTRMPKDVKIGYLNVEVELYIPNPRRCFGCQRYGHGKNTCSHDPVCSNCGQEGHDYEVCDNQTCCYHCEQEHPSSSKKCPMYKLEKEIMEVKIKQNISFKDARTKVYRANPNLTSEIPRLNSTSKTTYSQVSAQSTIPTNFQQQFLIQQRQIAHLTNKVSELLAIIHSRSVSQTEVIEETEMDTSNKQSSRGKRSRRGSSSSNEDSYSLPLKKVLTSTSQEDLDASILPLSSESGPSNRQEGQNKPAPRPHSDPSIRNEVKETPPQHQEAPSTGDEGAVGGVLDLTVLPPSSAPSAPPDQKVKEGVKDSSSGSSKSQRSYAFKTKKPPL